MESREDSEGRIQKAIRTRWCPDCGASPGQLCVYFGGTPQATTGTDTDCHEVRLAPEVD